MKLLVFFIDEKRRKPILNDAYRAFIFKLLIRTILQL